MAMFIMSANCAGIVGGQLFRSDDLPYYHRGWTIAVAFMSIALASVIVLLVLYAVANSRLKKSGLVIETGNAVEIDAEAEGSVSEGEQPKKVLLYNY